MAAEERRRSPRIMRSFIVRYHAADQPESAWLASPLRDLSSGGARFLSEHPLAVNDVLAVQLLLPSSQQPVALNARVAWVKQGPFNMVAVGVTFQAGDVFVQRTIDDAVAHFLRQKS